jgi:hypothetical protein
MNRRNCGVPSVRRGKIRQPTNQTRSLLLPILFYFPRSINANMAFALQFGLPAPVIRAERLKRCVFFKLRTELPVGPFCILYIHTTVQSDDNNPGMSILRSIYEELPPEYKERLQVFYFLHPGLRSRLAIATLGGLFLSGGLVLFLIVLRSYYCTCLQAK